jgi:hypothetical protein
VRQEQKRHGEDAERQHQGGALKSFAPNGASGRRLIPEERLRRPSPARALRESVHDIVCAVFLAASPLETIAIARGRDDHWRRGRMA